ncbi:MAG TPA: hypothetical protein VHE23_03210 [Candidatus Acidoferrales bacterium]|nr:hypothetical protein [Candidatus Acidoferrales bacterium]
MSTDRSQPPWDFLFSASVFSLRSFELSRLNHAANLRHDISRLLDQWVEESASALLARWLIQQRERSGGNTCEVCGAPLEPHRAEITSDNDLADTLIPGA